MPAHSARQHRLPLLAAATLLLALAATAQVEKLSAGAHDAYRQKLPALLAATTSSDLRAHLEAAAAPTATPTTVANAVRVAEAVQGKEHTGPLVHFAIPAMSDYQRLPDLFPPDGQALATVTIIAARDEYEPGSFLLYPLRSLGKVTLALEPFTSAQGDVFPTENLDLKVIKVWYQNANAWYSYFGDTGLKLTPELLLNDEDLIRVDTERVQNFARLTEADGTVSYEWITPPLEFDRRYPEHYRKTTVFQPMKPNFRDAATLQPVTLDDGQFKQFFLTAHVAANTRPGLYTGAIAVSQGDTRLATVPVAIRVLPFQLPQPKTYHDPYKDYITASYSYICLEMIAEENGGDLKLAEEQFFKVMLNHRQHNQQYHKIRFPAYTYEHNRQLELMRQAGIKTDRVLTRGAPGDNFLEWRHNAKMLRQWYDQNLGHHQVFIQHGDEPPAAWVIAQRDRFAAYQEQGFKFFIAGGDQVFFKAGYIYDFFNNATDPEDREATRKWNDVGNAWVAWYARHHVGPENPAYNRRQYGLAPYLANYSATCNYAHHFGPYNDRRLTYRPMVFAYGCYDGVIDTLQWEGYREGVDDIRYATLLTSLARQAVASKNLAVVYAGRQARQFLAEFDLARANLNAARLEIIGHILKLRRLLGVEG